MNEKNLLYPEAVKKLKKDLETATSEWAYLSSVGGGRPVEEFEDDFAKASGGKFCIAMTNATSALYVALMASDIGPGDEVILPSYTWPQTLTPVILTGATPVFVDIEENTVTISVNSVRRLITKKTRAIIAAHLFGIPADVVALEEIVKKERIILIFDAAQGFGAEVDGIQVGAYGDFSAYSFGRSKLFSVGEGGALVCRKKSLYEKAIVFSQHPLRVHKIIENARLRASMDGISMNFRIHPLVASLASGQLDGLVKSGFLSELRDRFKKISEKVVASGSGILPELPDGARPSGVCLPILSANVSNSGLKHKDSDIEIYEGGVPKPLHLTNTVRRHRIISTRVSIPAHKTHKESSCPNTERRCSLPQLFAKTTN
ncbi:MAG: aminotransferase class I/II-fold pyridoxal phosphate-dependent enzyme [Nitrospirae bacterium]|nr:aminotransferase class I/II-fold pyridoxal phosphate-dependent enzyme [Nitrospirota bacterium]